MKNMFAVNHLALKTKYAHIYETVAYKPTTINHIHPSTQ